MKAVEWREPVFIADAENSELLGEFAARAAEHGGKSLLALPLLADKRAVGALLLRSAGGRDPLDERAMRIGRIAAGVIAASLRGGRLHQTPKGATPRAPPSGCPE